ASLPRHRRLAHHRGRGPRPRHATRGAGARRRAVLHHQAAGSRHGARAVSDPERRRGARGSAGVRLGGRARHAGQFDLAGGGKVTATRPSILTVDDDEPFRKRLARAFVDRGFDARQAADYDGAMAAARAESPEYAVVDLKMPGRSGLELARDLLGIDATTRVVILTGYATVATTAWAMQLGVAWYLPKPADADDILAAFARATPGAPGIAAALAEAPPEPAAPTLERAKWEHIQRVLLDCDGNVSEAARRLGLHPPGLQRILGNPPPPK